MPFNRQNHPQKPLVMIVGPTAVGKTSFSIQLAGRVGGEIISADSRQFYRGMDIGTAKPEPQETARVPHHLVDIADPDQTIDLTKFHKLLRAAAEEIYARGHVPIMTGGTGQYARSILQGWDIPAQPPDERMREALLAWAKELGPFELHDRLRAIDPAAADFVQAQNVRRTVRALEVIFSTGRRFSAQRQQCEPEYRALMIGLMRERAELYARIDERIEQMIADGLLDEVKSLLDAGYDPALPALSAIGYKEMVDVLQGRLTLNEAVVIMKRRTREYVRRQANWFKPDDPNIHWFHPEGEGAVERAAELVEEFLL
jgi:tRNA dimethylallyltransferase